MHSAGIIIGSPPMQLTTGTGTGPVGLTKLKDIAFEGNSSYPVGFTEYKGDVYFSAVDQHGMELWKTDGTQAGTVMLKDIMPGTDSWGGPYNFTVFNDFLFFSANDGNGSELWKTDGTVAGTVRVKDIFPGDDGFGNVNGGNPNYLTVFNNELFFAASDGNGTELWKTDGTESGTVMVKDIFPGGDGYGNVNSGEPYYLTVFNNELFFAATDGNGTELWKTDGTESGTVMVKDIYPGGDDYGGLNSGLPNSLMVYNNVLYFAASDANGSELWRSDGTESGTVMVKDIFPGDDGYGFTNSGHPSYLTVFNDLLYFAAIDTNGTELWKTDGTEQGTVRVKDIYPGEDGYGTQNSGYPGNLIVMDDHLFFTATDGKGTELWKTDGTEQGTNMVRDINPDGNSSSPLELKELNGRLYFFADDGVSGYEVWESDGTEQGTKIHLDLNPGSGSSARLVIVHDPYAGDMIWWEGYLSVVGDKIYLSADNGVDGHELYVIESGSSSVNDEIFVMENQPAGTVIAQFNAIDWDGDDLTYQLVSGFEILDKTKPNEGNVTSSASNSSYPATSAFDDGADSESSRWLAVGSALPNVWIQYDFIQPTEISGYSIQSENYNYAERSPKDWSLQGSNDNLQWTVVGSESNQSGWGQWETRIFSVSNPDSYRYYNRNQ